MPSLNLPGTLIIVLGLAFGFLNGYSDSSNIVATMIASRALTGRQALTLTAVAESIAPLVFGVAVATTLGNGILDIHQLKLTTALCAIISAIAWLLLTSSLGIPSSSSHALVGGLVGAAFIDSGVQIIRMAGLTKVLVALFISPVLGLMIGYLVMEIVLFLVRNARPGINESFKRGQIFTALALALSYGTNDGQKTMGFIALGLVAAQVFPQFEIPLWLIVLSAAAIALGTWTGGWRLIRTLGGKFYKIRPIHGLTIQLSSALIILGAAVVGAPVSTTQVVSSAILGVGSAERLSKVRWGMLRQILIAWFTTIPASALLSALLAALARAVFQP